VENETEPEWSETKILANPGKPVVLFAQYILSFLRNDYSSLLSQARPEFAIYPELLARFAARTGNSLSSMACYREQYYNWQGSGDP
jgi:hypothetical protein